MKKIHSLLQFPDIKAALLACIFMILVTNVLAQEKPTESVQCNKTDIGENVEGCKNHKQYQRKQLTTKKLSPEIRTEALQRDREFNLNKFYPFLVGSGISN